MVRRLAPLVALAALGCRERPQPVPYLDVRVPSERHASAGPNAFGAYANLAERAAERADLSLDALDTPGNRRKALQEMGPLLLELSSATRLPSAFAFQPVGPFDPRPHQTGWLHLSRALVWRVEQAVEEGEWEQAAQWTVVATCFGADLAGGAVSDATLGYGVMDGARRAIAPYVATLPSSALEALVAGTENAIRRMPDPLVTIENESALMLAAVRDLQDAHREGRTKQFAERLYGDAREAALKFGALEGAERNAFVQSLLDAQADVAGQLRERALVPGATRGDVVIELEGGAGTIARHFFTAGGAWLSVRDLTLARTRLLYLTALIHKTLDRTGAAIPGLDDVDPQLATDPYTGMPMGYLALGQDFVVYSYGTDGKDDRGDTDSRRESPDLLLE
jgi:hypothetical protein